MLRLLRVLRVSRDLGERVILVQDPGERKILVWDSSVREREILVRGPGVREREFPSEWETEKQNGGNKNNG